MTSDVTIVVRYNEAKRVVVEQTLRKVMRTQGILLLILGVLWGLITLLPIVAVATDGQVNAAFVLGLTLVVPIAIGALGVRQLRRKLHMPASGLLKAARVVFTRQDGRKRRRRMVAADNIDVPARVIVEALGNTHTP